MYATGLSCWKCRIAALVNSSEKEENVPFCRFLVHCMTFSYSNRQLLHRLNNECKGLNRKSRLTSRHNGNKPRSPFGANHLGQTPRFFFTSFSLPSIISGDGVGREKDARLRKIDIGRYGRGYRGCEWHPEERPDQSHLPYESTKGQAGGCRRDSWFLPLRPHRSGPGNEVNSGGRAIFLRQEGE